MLTLHTGDLEFEFQYEGNFNFLRRLPIGLIFQFGKKHPLHGIISNFLFLKTLTQLN